MAQFSNIIITNQGRRLLAKAEAESLKLVFTKIQTSTDTYKEDALGDVTDFKEVKQEVSIDLVEFVEPDKVRISAELSNLELTTGYNINSYGIFAKTDLTDDILFACTTVLDGKADWMIPNNSGNAMSIHINAVLIIGQIKDVTVTVTRGEGVTYSEFNEHIKSGGKQNIHGSTSQAKENTLITRDNDGGAEINYPEKPSNTTIVNKVAMDTAIQKAVANIEIGDVGVPQDSVINYYVPSNTYAVGDIVAIETTMTERPSKEEKPPTPSEPAEDTKKDETESGGNESEDNGKTDTGGGGDNTEESKPTLPEDTDRVKVVSIGDTIQVGAAIYEAIDNVYEDEGFTDIKTNPTKYPDIWQFKRWALS